MSKIKSKKKINNTTELNTSQQKKILEILIEEGEDAIQEIINNVNNGYFAEKSNELTNELAQPKLLRKNEYKIIKEINRINYLNDIGNIIINRLNKNLEILPQASLIQLQQLNAHREREKALQSVTKVLPEKNNIERERALQSVNTLDTIKTNVNIIPPLPPVAQIDIPPSPPRNDNDDRIIFGSPNILTNTPKDPFTTEREPGSGPVNLYSIENIKDVSKELDFGDGDGDINLMNTSNDEFDGFMDIEEEKEKVGGKRCHRKMKTRKASRKTKSKSIIKHCSMRKNKRRRTFVKRR